MNILHLDSSVTGQASVSRQLTEAAAAKVKSLNPGATYVYRDLVKDTLRHYTAVSRIHGADNPQLNDEQKAELATGEKILQEFLGARTGTAAQAVTRRAEAARRLRGPCPA